MADYVLGLNCKLYRNTGTHASPVWDLITNVKDVTLDMSTDVADVSNRGGSGFRSEVPTLSNFKSTFQMVYNPEDTDQTAIGAAWLAKDTIEFMWLDGLESVAGSKGWMATCIVSNYSSTENLEEAKMIDVELSNAYSDYAPVQVTTTT